MEHVNHGVGSSPPTPSNTFTKSFISDAPSGYQNHFYPHQQLFDPISTPHLLHRHPSHNQPYQQQRTLMQTPHAQILKQHHLNSSSINITHGSNSLFPPPNTAPTAHAFNTSPSPSSSLDSFTVSVSSIDHPEIQPLPHSHRHQFQRSRHNHRHHYHHGGNTFPENAPTSASPLTSSLSLERSVTNAPDWNESVYKLSDDSVFISHPNNLGVSEASGYIDETLRFRQFRSVFISRSMHHIARNESHTPNAIFFRRLVATQDFLFICRRKRCFRKDFLPSRPESYSHSVSNITPTPRRYHQNYNNYRVDDQVENDPSNDTNINVQRKCAFVNKYFVRSVNATEKAREQYGEAIMSDVHLGFTRIFMLDEHIPSTPPTIHESVARPNAPFLTTPSILSVAVSYRHTIYATRPPTRDKILNIRDEQWEAVVRIMRALCERSGARGFRLWTDRMYSARPPPGTMRWVTGSVLPFMMFPVVYVPDGQGDMSSMRRMWLAVESMAANYGHGIIVAGDLQECFANDSTGGMDTVCTPMEWPNTYEIVTCSAESIDIDDNYERNQQQHKSTTTRRSRTENEIEVVEVNDEQVEEIVVGAWFAACRMDIVYVVKRVIGMIMCGLLRNKVWNFAHDAQALIEWASVISSTVSYGDLGHTFTCDDCRKPMGFSTDVRIITLLSSCIPLNVSPKLHEYQKPNTDIFPLVSVPAINFAYNRHSWHGLREWVPETCMWGAEEDERPETIRSFHEHSRGILTSDGGPRALSIVQFAVVDDIGDRRVLVGYLIVSVSSSSSENRMLGKVDWSKRFWPVGEGAAVRMWKCFDTLFKDIRNREALAGAAVIVGEASGLDYTDISNAFEVRKVNMRKVRWS